MEEKLTTYDMPETTTAEVIDKIAAYAKEIKFNPTFPGGECRAIVILTEKLKEMEKQQLESLKDFDTWKEWKNN